MKYIPLVQVCDFQGGSQPPKDQWIDHEKEGYIRMLQIRDFTQPDKDNVEFVRISKTIKTCNEDDILIGRYGASVGKILTGLAGAYNVAIIKTIPDTSKLSKRFLYHYLNSPYFQNFILSVGSRAAQAGFNKDDLSDAQIPDLSLEEQSNVVLQLDKVTELIALRKEQLAKLDQLVKSRFIELFGDLHSTKFPKCKMAEICNIKHGYAFSGEFFTEEDNNILLVTPGNFKVGGGFQEKKCKFFMGEYSEEYVLNCGDLIVTMTDLSKNMDTLGYSAIVPSTNRVYLHNQRIGLFVDMSENINKVFLMYFMQTNEYRDSIITSATGSTVHHTSPSKILACNVFLPPIELQDQFAAFVEQTDKSKLAIQQSLDKLELLKKSLMQEYFG